MPPPPSTRPWVQCEIALKSQWNGWSFLVKNITFSSFLAEFRHVEGRTIRYPYLCFNYFGHRIIEKYFRYIGYRYTSLVTPGSMHQRPSQPMRPMGMVAKIQKSCVKNMHMEIVNKLRKSVNRLANFVKRKSYTCDNVIQPPINDIKH